VAYTDWSQSRQRNIENALKLAIVWLQRWRIMKFAMLLYLANQMAKIQRQAGLFRLSQALDHRGIPADGEVATTSAVELRAEVERLRVLLRAMREAALSIKLGGG
jgi:hypothetical protein